MGEVRDCRGGGGAAVGAGCGSGCVSGLPKAHCSMCLSTVPVVATGGLRFRLMAVLCMLARRGITTKHAEGAKMEAERIVFKEESYRIIGACFEVYKEKGNGFLEAVYQECLTLELGQQQQLGLLVNFGHYPKIEHERFVNQPLSRISRIS